MLTAKMKPPTYGLLHSVSFRFPVLSRSGFLMKGQQQQQQRAHQSNSIKLSLTF